MDGQMCAARDGLKPKMNQVNRNIMAIAFVVCLMTLLIQLDEVDAKQVTRNIDLVNRHKGQEYKVKSLKEILSGFEKQQKLYKTQIEDLSEQITDVVNDINDLRNVTNRYGEQEKVNKTQIETLTEILSEMRVNITGLENQKKLYKSQIEEQTNVNNQQTNVNNQQTNVNNYMYQWIHYLKQMIDP